jgi:hypothetical protein
MIQVIHDMYAAYVATYAYCTPVHNVDNVFEVFLLSTQYFFIFSIFLSPSYSVLLND